MKFFSMKILVMNVALLIVAFFASNCFGQTDYEKSRKTEVWEPVPPVVTPAGELTAPSDAIVLFDGTDLSQWVKEEDGSAPGWKVEDGTMTVVKKTGGIKTKQSFGDCQLHVEFRTPANYSKEGQGKGNSGVFLMQRYEVQVLDSYENQTYSNGQAGSIYKQGIPLVNASKKPGEWQTYDIIFKAPTFNEDGSVKTKAYITVLHNGVLIQNNFEIQGPTVWIGEPSYEKHNEKEPISLQDHGDPVSYRNIWIREL